MERDEGGFVGRWGLWSTGISERAARSAAGGGAGHGPCEAAARSWRYRNGFWPAIGYLCPLY